MSVTITIEKINEKNDSYFLATSKDVAGFLVEGNTIDDIIKTSPDVVNSLIREKNKRIKRHDEIQQRINNVKYIYSYVTA